MQLKHLPLFLIGDRRAILAIASSRWAPVVGFLFVISVSLARNYDGADLLHEWDVLTHGLAASLGNAIVLFTLVYIVAAARGARPASASLPPFFPAFLAFLGLFWMTAPMGWLYGIPFERMFAQPVDAIKANLIALALVSVWRVLLITRVLSIMWNAAYIPLLLIVLLFSNVVVFIAANTMPTPLIDIMGGLQHTEEDALVAGISLMVQIWSFLLAPVLLIAAIIAARWFTPRWQVVDDAPRRIPRGPLVAGLLAILVWLPPMLITQPEQQNRRQAEALLRSGEVAHAFAFMSERSRADFPPVWDPPPRLGYGERTPTAITIAAALEQADHADWVYELYLPKLERSMWRSSPGWGARSMAAIAEYIEDALAHGSDRRGRSLDWLTEHRAVLRILYERSSTIPQREQQAIARLLELAEDAHLGPPSPEDP